MKKFNIPRNFRPTLVILAIVILGISVYRTVYVNIDSKYYLASEEEDPSVTNLPAGKETKAVENLILVNFQADGI